MSREPLSMREIQQVSLDILRRIAVVLESQGYRYTLGFGTLIGAIRHKGFIPWDDDIDIIMPRPDYEQFLSYMVEHPLEHLKVFNHKYEPKHPLGISRICDMRYRIYEKNFIDADMGIFVDVYPLDGLADTYEDAKAAFVHTDKSRADLLRLIVKSNRNFTFSQLIKKPRYVLSGIMLQLRGLSHVHRKLEKEAMTRPFSDYKYVGVSNWNWAHIVFQRDWFNEFQKAQFEDGTYNIITHYDDMLREEYGDYMQLPPEEKRTYHHQYIAYRR